MIVDLFCVDCGVTTRLSAALQLDPRKITGRLEMQQLSGRKTWVEYVELAVLCKGCHMERVTAKAEVASD